MTNARGICFRLGYNFRASTASGGRREVCHNRTVWHTGTLKYSHQPEEPEVFIPLPTTNVYSSPIVSHKLYYFLIVQCNVISEMADNIRY